MPDISDAPISQHHSQGNLQCLQDDTSETRYSERDGRRALVLSFRPLFDARIAFRECETFFFGTAKRNGGKSSKSD